MSKHETKFKNTAIKMNKALLDLLNEKEFKDISITDVCIVAGVNRSSFYSHYLDMYDLLAETKKYTIELFLNEFKTIEEEVVKKGINQMSIDETLFITPKYLLPYLKFIKNNKKIFKVYTNNLRNNTNEEYNNLMRGVIVPVMKKNGVNDLNVIKYMSKYYLNGITAIVDEWIQNDCIDDEYFICEVIIASVLATKKHD